MCHRAGGAVRKATMRRYETFLIRHWRLDGGAERVEVTHVPTGAQVLLFSLAQALEWMSAQMLAPAELPAISDGRDIPEVRYMTEG
jgi:hypothetical protein